MPDYNALRDTARRLILGAGRELTLTPAPTSDPAEPWKVGAQGAGATFTGVVTRFARGLVDGTTILADDRQIVAPYDTPTVPTAGDTVTDGAVALRVIDVEPIQPGDTLIAYRIQARA